MNVAILIAVDAYCDKDFPPVPFAAKDVVDLGLALQAAGFAAGDQTLLVNDRATKSTIESKIKTTLRALTSNDTVVLYYVGRGFSIEDRSYLACYDTLRTDLAATSVSLDAIFKGFETSSYARAAVMLDVDQSSWKPAEQLGHSTSNALNYKSINASVEAAGDAVCFISCDAGSSPWRNRQTGHGVWAQHVIEAFSGRARAAVNEAGLLTAARLQDHLDRSIPQTLRIAYAERKEQVPFLFGRDTDTFVLADLADVFADRTVNHELMPEQALRVSFVGDRLQRIQSLSAFNMKTHRVPELYDNRAEDFVARLVTQDIDQELEQLFSALRQAFRFKRSDIEVSDPGDGTGTIITPYFNFSVCAALHTDDLSEVVWNRRIGDTKQPDQVLTDEFGRVFGDLFDTLEFNPPDAIDLEALIDRIESLDDDRISVDYDRSATWCSLAIEGIKGEIEVTATTLSIVQDKPRLPRELLDSFFEIQFALSETFDVKSICFDAAVGR